MRHRILTTILTLGVVGGLASGFLELHRGSLHRPTLFQDHVADVCAEAALRAVEREKGAK